MRDTIVTSLLLASAAFASASRLECLHTRSRELAAAASCGDEGSLNYCFSHLLPPTSSQPDALSRELERCFHSAGCTPAEAQIEAFWLLRRCDAPPSNLRRGRRQPPPTPATAADLVDDPATSLAAAVDEPLLLGVRADAAAAAFPATITAMNLPRQARESPYPCYTYSSTTTTTCPVQTTGPDEGKRLSCFPTAVATPVCRDELLCEKGEYADDPRTWKCMYKESLGASGIIMAVIFALVVATSIVSVTVLCCRERREQRRMEQAAEAARIAKEAKATPQPAGAAARRVVSAAPAASPIRPASSQGQQQDSGGANPFMDSQDGSSLR